MIWWKIDEVLPPPDERVLFCRKGPVGIVWVSRGWSYRLATHWALIGGLPK